MVVVMPLRAALKQTKLHDLGTIEEVYVGVAMVSWS